MSINMRHPNPRRNSERGSIVIMTALFMVILFLFLGLCIDVSRIYVERAELQNAADAAALTAARELNGGSGGIDDAVNQAINVISNNHGLQGKTSISIASIEFTNQLDGTYWNATDAKDPSRVANIRFARVTTQQSSTAILFGLGALGAEHIESRQATAGKSVDLAGLCDFYPAAVGMIDQDTTDVDANGQPVFTLPAPGTNLTLTFAQGTGTTATIHNMDYIVLEVGCITGNGDVETARLSAGEPCACNNLGGNINMTPSSNFGNGGNAAGDGMNTRFGTYVGGYGGYLTAANFAADTNSTENITYTQYINKDPTQGNERRVVIAPIIAPGDYPANTNGQILSWGKFFLKKKMYVTNGNCANNPPCGEMSVEFVGKADVGARGPVACGSGLRTSVLYR